MVKSNFKKIYFFLFIPFVISAQFIEKIDTKNVELKSLRSDISKLD